MGLYTESKDVTWERRVDLFVSDNNDIQLTINDTDTFKLLILKSGILSICSDNKELSIVAPALIYLSNADYIEVMNGNSFEAVTVYFNPTVIHDSFTYSQIESIDQQMLGTALYQDYLLIKPFVSTEHAKLKVNYLNSNSLRSIIEKIAKMNDELTKQYDGYWPCRSRSYFIELLFFINYSCAQNDNMENAFSEPLIADIINYFNEHINDRILLEDITRKFSINRNSLNKLFMDKMNTTCLDYLLKMRIDLAKIMLAETELPIGEISERVGFLDSNYFTKVFKKANNVTPSYYRSKRI